MGYNGCYSHSCVIKKPDGMGVNGPCRCDYIDKYQAFVKRVGTDKVVGEENRISWAIEEMLAEAGECLSLSVKAKRRGLPIDKEKLFDELADTLWGYVAVMNEAFPEVSLQDLMKYNVDKLEKRIASQKS